MTMNWSYQQFPFRFQISDLPLFELRRSLWVRQLAVDEVLTTDSLGLQFEAEDKQPSAGYLLRSLPLDQHWRPPGRDGDYIRYNWAEHNRYVLTFNGSFEDYVLHNFSSKTRATIRRKIRKYREYCDGEIDFHCYRTVDELISFHCLVKELAQQTYQAKLFGSGLPESEAFLQHMKQLGRENRARGYILFHAGKPVTYLYMTASDKILSYDFLGYDPSYAQWSVGTILHWLAVEDLFREQDFTMLDFTEGEGEHKRRFATSSTPCANVFFLRNTWSNRFLVHAHRSMNGLSRSLGQLADKWGLKVGIKRLIRFGKSSAKPIRVK